MDTVDDVFRVISPEELENLKTKMVRELLTKKVFHKFRLLACLKYGRVHRDYLKVLLTTRNQIRLE